MICVCGCWFSGCGFGGRSGLVFCLCLVGISVLVGLCRWCVGVARLLGCCWLLVLVVCVLVWLLVLVIVICWYLV